MTLEEIFTEDGGRAVLAVGMPTHSWGEAGLIGMPAGPVVATTTNPPRKPIDFLDTEARPFAVGFPSSLHFADDDRMHLCSTTPPRRPFRSSDATAMPRRLGPMGGDPAGARAQRSSGPSTSSPRTIPGEATIPGFRALLGRDRESRRHSDLAPSGAPSPPGEQIRRPLRWTNRPQDTGLGRRSEHVRRPTARPPWSHLHDGTHGVMLHEAGR